MAENTTMPPVGMALWLLTGGTLADRVEWLAASGFNAASLLEESVMLDEQERAEAAAAMREAGLRLTYHPNFHSPERLTPAGDIDFSYIRRILDDVLWWHEHTCGVASCCIDPVSFLHHSKPLFSPDASRRVVHAIADRLGHADIRPGIENTWGVQHSLGSLDAIARFKALCDLPSMGLLLDAGHTNIHVRSDGMSGETEIGDFVRALPLEVLEVHLSDNQGEHDEHRGIRCGNLDLRSLLQALKDTGFRGQLTVEVCADIANGRYASDISNPAETAPLLRSLDALRSTWHSLGGVGQRSG